MSQKVNAVPDSSFSVPPLTTTAGTRVSRRRIRVPCNYPGTKYGHNGQSTFPSVVTFDIADNESFLDIEKSMIVLDFKSEIFQNEEQAKQSLHPISFDGSSQALMARIRIGNSQGLVIEELQAYGTWANIMDSYSESEDQMEHHLIDYSSARKNEKQVQKTFGASEYAANAVRSHQTHRLYLRFKHSSFLKSCRMIPLFLMRNGLRFEIEFENVYKALTRSVNPNWMGPFLANAHPLTTTGDVGFRMLRESDFWCAHESERLALVIPNYSKIASALNLAHLLRQNINTEINMNDGNASFIACASLKQTAGWSLPFKLEYTDEFGVDKVLIQGVGVIHPRILQLAADGSLAGTPEIDELKEQYMWLSGPPILDASQNFGVVVNPHDSYAFMIHLAPEFDGFVNAAVSAGTTVGIPYHNKKLRLYVSPDDLLPVPRGAVSDLGYKLVEGVSSYTVNLKNALNDNTTDEEFFWPGYKRGEDVVQGSVPQNRYAPWGVFNSAKWDYTVANVEMICDFVKPSSEVFLQFQQSFQAPAGIPYAYNRVLYHTRVLNPSEGLQQISLPISVRSLRGIVCVLSDKLAWAPSHDKTSRSFNSLSAFMKRGLIRAQLVIGGQNYPSYDLNLTECGVEQIPELECLFNVAKLGSFNPSFCKKELYSTRNYMIGVGKDESNRFGFDGGWIAQPNAESNNIQEYHDTSKFVLGLSTMKKDGDFVTGVDTSQAGSVSLNLFFKRTPDLANQYPGDKGNNRDIFVQVFALADAVFTLQNDANLVRY